MHQNRLRQRHPWLGIFQHNAGDRPLWRIRWLVVSGLGFLALPVGVVFLFVLAGFVNHGHGGYW